MYVIECSCTYGLFIVLRREKKESNDVVMLKMARCKYGNGLALALRNPPNSVERLLVWYRYYQAITVSLSVCLETTEAICPAGTICRYINSSKYLVYKFKVVKFKRKMSVSYT